MRFPTEHEFKDGKCWVCGKEEEGYVTKPDLLSIADQLAEAARQLLTIEHDERVIVHHSLMNEVQAARKSVKSQLAAWDAAMNGAERATTVKSYITIGKYQIRRAVTSRWLCRDTKKLNHYGIPSRVFYTNSLYDAITVARRLLELEQKGRK